MGRVEKSELKKNEFTQNMRFERIRAIMEKFSESSKIIFRLRKLAKQIRYEKIYVVSHIARGWQRVAFFFIVKKHPEYQFSHPKSRSNNCPSFYSDFCVNGFKWFRPFLQTLVQCAMQEIWMVLEEFGFTSVSHFTKTKDDLWIPISIIHDCNSRSKRWYWSPRNTVKKTRNEWKTLREETH